MTMKAFTDIETIPDQRPGAFDRYLDKVKPPANYKKPETIDKWMAENAESEAESEFLKTGLSGLHGEICSIAFALDDRDIKFVTRGVNAETEVGLLAEFWSMLQAEIENALDGSSSDRAKAPFVKLQWVGHNLLDFDLRFLLQRSVVNGIRPAYTLPADARHGSDWVFDTMKAWAGWRGYVKQDDLCEALGIVAPDETTKTVGDVDGSQVWSLFRAGEFDTIADYNVLDVWKVREIWRRMTYAT